MLRQILFGLVAISIFSIAGTEGTTYEAENKILKLKLEIYELKAENTQLQKIINDLSSNSEEKITRASAIAKFRKELRMSRTQVNSNTLRQQNF